MVHGDIPQRLRVQVVAARADSPLLRVRRKHMAQRPNYGVHRLLRRRRPQILRPHPANRRRRRMVPPRKMRSLFACRRFVVPQISADRQKPDLHPVRRQRIHILAHPGIADPEKKPRPGTPPSPSAGAQCIPTSIRTQFSHSDSTDSGENCTAQTPAIPPVRRAA